MSHRIFKIILAVTLSILAVTIIAYSFLSRNKLRQTNVILITLDSLRPDHLGCYGYRRNTSPNIDRLAKAGVAFTQAVAQGFGTLISVPSFITSSYPYMHLTDIKKKCAYLNPSTLSLPEILKQNGYETALFNDHPTYFGRIYGIKDYFDTNVELETDNPKRLTQLVLRWMRKNQNKKFFLWLYYFGPHSPYNSSLPYSGIFYNDNLPRVGKNIPIANEDGKEVFGVIPKYIAEDNITDVDYYIAKYDGKIRIVDEQIGLLLEEMKKLHLDKKTIIILISDHGESLGEHNYYFSHGRTLYDELLRVPFIMSSPRIIPKNKRIDAQVGLIDMLPTALDLLGIDYRKFRNIEGVSLRPYFQGLKLRHKQYAFGGDLIYYIRSQDWKLISNYWKGIKEIQNGTIKLGEYFQNADELYNLKNDPLEQHNLINKNNKEFEALKQNLNDYIMKARQKKKEINQLRKNMKGIKIPRPLDKETKDKLKSLGYM